MNINMEKQEIGKFYATSFNDIVIEFIVFDDNTIDCPTLGLQDYNSIELKPKFELHGHKIDKDGNLKVILMMLNLKKNLKIHKN